MKIKNWYLATFPEDKEGQEIKGNVTFKGLQDCLYERKSVYKYLGGVDSVIRERVFEKLAEIRGVDYGYIYDLWLKGVN